MTHTLRKYILAGCVDKDGQWRRYLRALPPFFHLLGGRVSAPLTHSLSLSDSPWHSILIGNCFSLLLTHSCSIRAVHNGTCQKALNHQLLNIEEQYYIQDRIICVLIRGLRWCLGNRGMPPSPPQLGLDTLCGLPGSLGTLLRVPPPLLSSLWGSPKFLLWALCHSK